MALTTQQAMALTHVALLAEECAHPRFGKRTPLGSIVLTVNAGYEWIEMDFGGPVWHASARAINEPSSWRMATNALAGVGDPALGEWRERGENGVMHLRRRLTDIERACAGNLAVRDIRGTAEERVRFDALFAAVPGLRAVLRARGMG